MFFSEDEYSTQQDKLKDNLLENISGYNVYEINQKLDNPFFKNENKLESIFYFQEKDYAKRFKKIRYFINKVMATAEEIEYYPIVNYDSKNSVQIICYNHETDAVDITDDDIILSEKITKIWNIVK